MTEPQAPPTPSGVARLHGRRHPRPPSRLKTLVLIATIVALFTVGIIVSGSGGEFLRNLYSPVAVVIVIFLVMEYILLKGRDRSRIYKIELEQLREKRRQDIEFLRHLELELADLDRNLKALGESGSALDAPLQNIARARERLTHLRQELARKQ